MAYRGQCTMCFRQKKRHYKSENKENISIKNRIYRQNKIATDPSYMEKARESARRYKNNNRDKIQARERSEEKMRAKKAYREHKMMTDPNWRIRYILRNRFQSLIKKEFKKSSCLDILGCSVKEFKQYIEIKFEPGMMWSNHGKWHIDHIVPCSKFDLTNYENQKICFHYSNMQPMWAKDNLAKGNRG
jgi:hypothetical protein